VQTFYSIAMWVGIIVAILFAGLVFLTGKGDAMSGGSGSIRTTFKGKTSFDDIMSTWTLRLGILFMALMLFIDVLGNNLPTTLK
jgi:protein translocase SecG subunit